MQEYSQLLANTLIGVAHITLFALGLLLVYRACAVLNFAQGAFLTCGAYSALALKNYCAFPIFTASAVGVVVTIGLGCAVEKFIFRVLRRKGATSLVLLIASLGLYVSLVSIIAIAFGEGSRTLRTETVSEGISALCVWVTLPEILTLITTIIIVCCLSVLSRHTRIGKAALATASDYELARTTGINTDKVRLYIAAIAAGLAGIAGIFAGFDRNIVPNMGMSALMTGIVAVVVGGGRTVVGVTTAAFALGVLQTLIGWTISAEWKDAGTFVFLLAFLLVRPEGMIGKKFRKATV